jgi:hypothetical protein
LTSGDVKQTTAGISTSINNNDVEFDNLLDYVDQDNEVLLAVPISKTSQRVNEGWPNKLRSTSQIESTYCSNDSVSM